jgi:hypothetical protein
MYVQVPSKSSHNWFITQKKGTLHLFVDVLGSSSVLSVFLKLIEAFLETVFQYRYQCSHHFCSDFFGGMKHCPFRILFSPGNNKNIDDKSREYGRSKAITLCLARYVLTTNY